MFDANIMGKAIPSTSFSSEGAVPSISTVPHCDCHKDDCSVGATFDKSSIYEEKDPSQY